MLSLLPFVSRRPYTAALTLALCVALGGYAGKTSADGDICLSTWCTTLGQYTAGNADPATRNPLPPTAPPVVQTAPPRPASFQPAPAPAQDNATAWIKTLGAGNPAPGATGTDNAANAAGDSGHAASPAQNAQNDKAAFINEMVTHYNFDRAQLNVLFAYAKYSAAAIRLVSPSSKSGSVPERNWHAQEARFVDSVRINAGAQFWRENHAVLQRAYHEMGVPPEIIAGIIGTETIYGRDMGKFPVLDVLTTLAFNYPDTPNRAERMAMFRKDLQDYLLWTRYEHIDPTTVLGSYTGAIGIPQFMPSNILQYAVDYQGTQHIDLRTNMTDAIGSVANYLKALGWEPGRPVVWRIASDPRSQNVASANATGQADLHLTLGQLVHAGLTLAEPDVNVAAAANTPVTIIDLPTPGRPTQYLLGLKNFYVLTRYNRSFFYAMSVYELGQRIKAQVLATTPNEAIN